MFSRLIRWLRDARHWHTEHNIAWSTARRPGPNGLSPFQEKCEAAVVKALLAEGLDLEGRVLKKTDGDSETCVNARIKGTPWELWLYYDGGDIAAGTETLVRLEEWDAKTPDELAGMFVEEMVSGLKEWKRSSV